VGFSYIVIDDKGEESTPKFIPSSDYHKEETTIKSTKTHYPSNPKPSFNPMRDVKKETLKLREEAFVCIFCGCADHLDKFCFCHKRIEKRSFEHARNSNHDEFFFIFRLVLTLVLRLALLLMLCLISLIKLTIAHMVLVHEMIALCLDALIIAHVLIVVIISRVGMIFLLESLTSALSPNTWMVHAFPVMVLIPLVQRVRCKRL
jgi:hypothetical protein